MRVDPHVLSSVRITNYTGRLLPISAGIRLQPGQTLTVNVPFVQLQEEMVPRLNQLVAAGMVGYSLQPGRPSDIGDAGGVFNQVAANIWGDGTDGVSVFDGVATFGFANLVGSTYTLTRDTFVASSTIRPGITLATGGFKFFCRGTLTNNGTISNRGKDAVAGTAGAGSALGTLGIGTAGGNGRSNNTGQPGSAQSNMLQDTLAAGGAGGAGGVNAGGLGGTYGGGSSGNGGGNFLTPVLTGCIFGQTSGGNQAQVQIIGGGAGGGGGGSDGPSVTGGGGGGGGGVLIVHAQTLVNNGTIAATGGNGAAATGTGANGGGGGGGGGGVLLSIVRSYSGGGTITVAGGAGGASVGTGIAGAPGGPGHINMQYA